MTNEEIFRPLLVHVLKTIDPWNHMTRKIVFVFQSNEVPNIKTISVWEESRVFIYTIPFKGLFGRKGTEKVRIARKYIELVIKDNNNTNSTFKYSPDDQELLDLYAIAYKKSEGLRQIENEQAINIQQEQFKLMIKNTIGDLC